MAKGHCVNCGTGLERSGICPNCDEAAFIMDTQGEFLPEKGTSEEFHREAAAGYRRANERKKQSS